MIAKAKKKRAVNWEVEDRQKDLLFQKYGVLPCEVTDEGYWYDDVATKKIAKAVKEERKKQ